MNLNQSSRLAELKSTVASARCCGVRSIGYQWILLDYILGDQSWVRLIPVMSLGRFHLT